MPLELFQSLLIVNAWTLKWLKVRVCDYIHGGREWLLKQGTIEFLTEAGGLTVGAVFTIETCSGCFCPLKPTLICFCLRKPTLIDVSYLSFPWTLERL